jgi:hypothetical protein
MAVKFPNAKVRLTGTDGNAFSIMGKVSEALKRAGATQAQINEYVDESMSGDYDHLLQTATSWVEVS